MAITTSPLFTPLAIGPVEAPNRIAVSPMCQYSADDGSASDWHLQHLMTLAMSGAGLVILEATAVERRGRITHGDLGLYSEANEAALSRVLAAARRVAPPATRFGVQIAHAGRKASARRPWEGGGPLEPDEDPWATVGPSAVPFTEGWHTPEPLDAAGRERVISAFEDAARRAVRLGFEVIELHGAHGYLLHQFLSPLANRREDAYGGPLENRMRFPLEVAEAVRCAVPAGHALGARINGTDWVEGGITLDEAVVFATALQEVGIDYVCMTSGGGVASAKIPVAPGYQVPFAAELRARTRGLVVQAVGMIADPLQAEAIVAQGQADQVALARAFLDDPRWVWHAAERLGGEIAYPPQYARSQPGVWPGAKLARPPGAEITSREKDRAA